MCLICVDLQRDVLTVTESWKNLQEMKDSMPDEHYDDVVTLILDKLYDEQIEAEDEEELSHLMETLEEKGQLSFGYESADEPIHNHDYDVDYPWYIPGYED